MYLLQKLLDDASDDFRKALHTAIRCINDHKKYYEKVRFPLYTCIKYIVHHFKRTVLFTCLNLSNPKLQLGIRCIVRTLTSTK